MAEVTNPATEEQIDPVVDFIGKTQTYVSENKNLVIGAIVGVVVLIGGIFGYTYYAASQDQKAQVLLSQAEVLFKSADYTKALKGDDINFTPGFEQIINNYGSTDAGNLAYYYAAVSEFNLGNYQTALNYIDQFDQPTGILGVGPIAFKATLFVALSDFAKAAYQFEKAANWVSTETTTPMYLVESAKYYIKAGEKDKASKIIETLLNDYPTGTYAADAQRLKGQVN